MSPSVFAKERASATLVTRVNGKVKQDTVIEKDMIYSPERILSWMSQSMIFLCLFTFYIFREAFSYISNTNPHPGTTIPAYTVVMTGTPAGVGIFQKPRQLLKDGDQVEVEISGLGTLKNVVRFEEGEDSIM